MKKRIVTALTVNTYKYKNSYLLVCFYALLSFLHFKYIITFDDFKYVSLYASVDFVFVPLRYLMASLIILLNILFLLLYRKTDFLYSILVLILFFFVMPSALVFSSSKSVFSEIFVLHNVFFYSVALLSTVRWNFKFPTLNTKQAFGLLFFGVLIGILPFIVIYGPYINLKNLLLINIYRTRTLVTENIDNFYTAYTYSWFSKIIIPILIVFSIYFKTYKRLSISIFALLFLFLCGAHKTVFAGVVLLLVFYNYDYLKKTHFFLISMMVLMLVSLLASFIFGYDYIWDISFRRVLMLTALLDYCYFDFFKDAPIYWSNSFMSSFIEYPHELSPDHMIGKVYFNKPDVNANIGIISDGFKNLGLWGSLINIMVVSVYLSVLNTLRISSKFFGLFVLLIFSFLNSALTTILLTHGGLLLLLISLLILRNTEVKMDGNNLPTEL